MLVGAAHFLPHMLENKKDDQLLPPPIQLRRGLQIPRVGCGSSHLGSDCLNSITEALRRGYRMVDTAQQYRNEHIIAQAMQAAEVPRHDVFIVTKLGKQSHGDLQVVREALLDSLQRLQSDYVDLFLIHGPGAGMIEKTWAAIIALRDEGLCRAVGVANFGVEQLEGLRAAGLEMPEVNEIELHVWNQQHDVVNYCRENQIVNIAYSPLGRSKKFGETRLANIADSFGCTEAELCLRWSVQNGFIPIPRSSNPGRIQENLQTVQQSLVSDNALSSSILSEIEALDEGSRFKACSASAAMATSWAHVSREKGEDRKNRAARTPTLASAGRGRSHSARLPSLVPNATCGIDARFSSLAMSIRGEARTVDLCATKFCRNQVAPQSSRAASRSSSAASRRPHTPVRLSRETRGRYARQ